MDQGKPVQSNKPHLATWKKAISQ